MKVSKYAVALSQLEDHRALPLDAHMFFMKTQEEYPDIITAIMTQILLKTGLK